MKMDIKKIVASAIFENCEISEIDYEFYLKDLKMDYLQEIYAQSGRLK
ncbi:MAG: hypothetical protein RLZZ577_82 [Bacteroidota bacterium]|jgi:hypothetical protein